MSFMQTAFWPEHSTAVHELDGNSDSVNLDGNSDSVNLGAASAGHCHTLFSVLDTEQTVVRKLAFNTIRRCFVRVPRGL